MPTCNQCGKPLKGVQQRFCSSTCRNRYHYINRHLKTNISTSKRRIIRQSCAVCGNQLSGKQTRFCSVECKNELHQSYPKQQQRGLRRKLELVQMLGGQCMHCGYKKNLAALSFHHENEDAKSHEMDMRSLSNRRMERVMSEFEKCILLCANCHMELHYPYLDMAALISRD